VAYYISLIWLPKQEGDKEQQEPQHFFYCVSVLSINSGVGIKSFLMVVQMKKNEVFQLTKKNFFLSDFLEFLSDTLGLFWTGFLKLLFFKIMPKGIHRMF
jgi:hypothetical protein